MIGRKRYKKLFGNSTTGFTLVEIILVVAIFGILLVVSLVALGNFRDDSELGRGANNVQAVLRLAQSRTVSSENDTRYGVYFTTSTSPHEYVLFETATGYASRVTANDKIYELGDFVEFSSISFSGLSGQEVVFDRIQGTTSQDGSLVLRSTVDAGNVRIVSVSGAGNIDLNAGAAPSDTDRVKDSRHMHVTYAGRQINTSTEIITLDFSPSAASFDIDIASNLSGGQIVWEGTVDVDGEDQVLKVHTHTLNDVGFTTEFSIHRDVRFNTKPVLITLSGDTSTGKLIEYNASGIIITGGESTNVSITEQQ